MNSMNLSSLALTSFPSQDTDMANITTTSSLRHVELTVTPSIEGQTEHDCQVPDPRYSHEDNTQGIVSQQTHFWITMITYGGIIPLLFLVGVPGNILSAAVFYKQGLRERINLCVFCLSLVDVVVMTGTFSLAVEKTYYRLFVGPSNFFIKYLQGLTGFNTISMFLSAVIAAERCFCVVSPLRAQRMLSTRTLAVVITSISLLLLTGMLVIVGPKLTEICVFDPKTKTISWRISVSEYYLKNMVLVDIFDIFIYATTLPAIFWVSILTTTSITAMKLRSALHWRQQSSSASGVQTTSSSEAHMVALTWMLVATSVLFMVCSSPILIVQMAMFIVEEIQSGGRYKNLTELLWNVMDVCRCVNSSMNFFIYYRMGSRFRQTLKQILCCKRAKMEMSRSDTVDSTRNTESAK